MLDQILTKEQKKALKKWANDPKTKKRHERMDKIFQKWEAERLWKRIQKDQQDKKTRKEIIGFAVLFIVLGFVVWLTV